MYFAYVLKSIHQHYYYKGHCKDLQIRMDQHNARLTSSNKPYRPFQIVYFEQFETEADAIERESILSQPPGAGF